MIVCIAEKPSVAEDIAKIIGATQRHRVGAMPVISKATAIK